MEEGKEKGHKMSHDDLQLNFERHWALMGEVRVAGGFESYVAAHAAGVCEAFVRLALAIGCMDEGVERTSVEEDMPPMFKTAIALADRGALAAFAKLVGLDLTWHRHCGAGALLAERLGQSASRGDEVARQFLTEVAKEADVRLLESPLDRPITHHVAVCTYVTNLGFGPSHAHDVLPRGFVVSDILGWDKTVQDVNLSIAIAMGDHGFGDLFTKDCPFTVVAVAGTAEELGKLRADLEPIVEAANAAYPSRVLLDGFVKPSG